MLVNNYLLIILYLPIIIVWLDLLSLV